MGAREASGFVGVVALWSSLVGCGGAAPGQKVGQQGLVQRANVACNAAEKGVSELFTVEWDATKITQFEALASRDTVFVHFEGCKLDIIEGCNDDRIPGKLGAYGTPLFTSGAEKELVIRNRDELHAELPLGVAALGGRVDTGESLRLKYYVTGVGRATRSNLYESAIAGVPECKAASHFVASYELGAFLLEAGSATSVASSGKVSGVGSAGGSTERSESSLARAGNIASCASHAKDGCRVPIRLHLKKIRSGAQPADADALAVEPKMGPSTADDFFAWHERMLMLSGEAREKLAAGDGKACLRVLDVDMQFKERSARNDAHRGAYLVNYSGFRRMQADCLAAAGKCAEGVEAHIDSVKLGVETHKAMGFARAPQPDEQLQAQARSDLAKWCPQFKK